MDAIKQIQSLQNELNRFAAPKQVPQAQAQTPAPSSANSQAAVVKFDSRATESSAKESESPKEEASKSETKDKEKSVLGSLDVEA